MLERLKTTLSASVAIPSCSCDPSFGIRFSGHRPARICFSGAQSGGFPPPGLGRSLRIGRGPGGRWRRRGAYCKSGRVPAGDAGDDLEAALHMDGAIPGNSVEFVQQVSSRAYGMRRHLEQTIGCSSYDVLEVNPWRESSKPVYVLTQRENQLCTMKTRRNRSEVEKELRLLFTKGRKQRAEVGSNSKKSIAFTNFQMLVEDIIEGVLVFEDEQEAVTYCDLLQGGGQGCEGVAELEASLVFDICQKMRGLAILFRRGRIHPLPESLKRKLKARKRSLEDQEDLI